MERHPVWRLSLIASDKDLSETTARRSPAAFRDSRRMIPKKGEEGSVFRASTRREGSCRAANRVGSGESSWGRSSSTKPRSRSRALLTRMN